MTSGAGDTCRHIWAAAGSAAYRCHICGERVTITAGGQWLEVKRIGRLEYLYLRWREGGRQRSRYIGRTGRKPSNTAHT